MGDGFDDAQVGLVGDDAGDVFDGQAGVGEGPITGIEHGGDGVFVSFFAVHLDAVQALIGVVFGDGKAGGAAGNPEDIGETAIATHVGGNDAFAGVAVLENCGPRAIAEEDAGVAIGPVDNAGKSFCANDEDGVMGSGGDELLGDFQGVQEA